LKRRIRVLYTIPNFDTAGSGKALLNIAMGLDKNKFEAHLLCSHSRGAFFEVVKESGISVHIFDYLSPARPIYKLFVGTWKVSHLLKKIQPDIIHSFHYSADYTEALAAKMAGIPWVFTKKNMNWGGASKRSWWLRSKLAAGIIIENTDMKKMFYPDRSNVELIPRGVNIKSFVPQNPNILIRTQMNTLIDERVIICVANFIPVKGLEVLLQAFELLVSEFPKWKLWLIGDETNEYGKKIKSWVQEHNLDSKVHFSGKQADVGSYLDHSEIFVLPTLSQGEGFGVAMLEAMANGKIVLGSDVPGIRDQLKNYPANLFSAGDWRTLAERLAELMQKPIVYNQTEGENFIQHVQDEFSLEKEILKHENFYQRILSA
jgi:glycosyltransferase involved in cell wall biosynthesis